MRAGMDTALDQRLWASICRTCLETIHDAQQPREVLFERLGDRDRTCGRGHTAIIAEAVSEVVLVHGHRRRAVGSSGCGHANATEWGRDASRRAVFESGCEQMSVCRIRGRGECERAPLRRGRADDITCSVEPAIYDDDVRSRSQSVHRSGRNGATSFEGYLE
jgi:hypothetical protein